ncbi:MAG: VOC family protein [Acetobacteraceae bacterium]
MSAALDHVGIVTDRLADLAESYTRLGFTLSPLARQADGRIGNRCVMLPCCYIELLAVVDPNARSATLECFLARYAGVHILAFRFTDETAELARLRRAGVEASSVSRFERLVDDADPDGPRARFALIQTPDQPEGRINLVRHLAPEALWQPRFLAHANNVASLDEVVLAVADPADTAARLSRLIGCVAVPDPTEGFALELSHGRIRIHAAATGVVPRITGLTLGTSDAAAAIARTVVERGIAHHREPSAWVVEAAAAGGVELRFAASAAA